MSGVKHTPGPWAVEDPMDHCLTIVANPEAPVYDWKWIATCDWPDEDNHDLTAREVKANARLMAAAPELLEAGVGLLAAYRSAVRTYGDEALDLIADHPASWASIMEAAIARARGEQDEGGE